MLLPGQVYDILDKASLHGFDLGCLRLANGKSDREPEHAQVI